MKVGTSSVKASGKSLGEITYDIFDNLAEAGEKLGQAIALDLLNIQVKTTAMNQFRQSKTGKPSRARLQEEAWDRVTEDDFASAQGDRQKLKEMIQGYVDQIKAERGIGEDSDTEAEREAANG